MNLKKLGILLVMAVMVSSLSVLFVGCAGMNNGYTHKMVPKSVHSAEFPDGHSGRSHAECVYDQEHDVYLCPY